MTKNDPFTSMVKYIQKLYLRYLYLFKGAQIIKDRYETSNGMPFSVHTPTNRQVVVSSAQHIREYSGAPSDQLSLYAVAKETFQPKHTMCKFEWKDKRGSEGLGFIHTLRVIITSRLPSLAPKFRSVIAEEMQQRLQESPQIHGWNQYRAFEFAEHISSRINCLIMFGSELCEQPGFVQLVVQFTWDTLYAAEVVRTLPPILGPMIARYMTNNYRASNVLYDYLYPIVDERMRLRDLEEGDIHRDKPKPDDGIQWLVDTSRQHIHTTPRMIGEIISVLFGSMHTTSLTMTNAMIDLALHPECIEPLREEVESGAMDDFVDKAEGLPLLDSFMKESARLHGFDFIGARRRALKPFTFSDGLRVDKGDWICIPQYAMMYDDRYFPEPHRFNAFRWINGVQPKNPASNTPYKMTDVHPDWYMWGSGRLIW